MLGSGELQELQPWDPSAAPQSHTKPSVWRGAGQAFASINKVFPKSLARAVDSHKELIFCSRQVHRVGTDTAS